MCEEANCISDSISTGVYGSMFAEHPETESQSQTNWSSAPAMTANPIVGSNVVCAGNTAGYSCTGTDDDTKQTRSRSRTELPIYDEECPPNLIGWYWPEWPDWPPWTTNSVGDGAHVIKWEATDGSISADGSFTAPSDGGQYVTITATLDDEAPEVDEGSRNDGTVQKTKEVAIVKVATVAADKPVVAIDDDVMFTATTDPAGYENLVTWSGGEEPATGEGKTFSTSWPDPGEYTVTASCGTSSKSTNVVVLKVEIKRPAGDPTTEPNAYNERTYNSASLGVATVVCEAEDTPNADKLRWTIEDVGEIQATWDPHVDGDTHIGKGGNPTATFTGLPAQYDAFGSKTITLTMDEPGITSSDTQEVEIFFPRSATNHSFIDPNDPKQEGPNWYYYSLQILPCIAAIWFYENTSEQPAWTPMNNYTEGWIRFTDLGCPGNPFYYIAHENKHHTDFFQEIWQGTGYEETEDEDEDGIRDDFEIDLSATWTNHLNI